MHRQAGTEPQVNAEGVTRETRLSLESQIGKELLFDDAKL